jgi:subtilisin family serine protease
MSEIGGPIVFATVDTGVDYTHPDLQASMWSGLGVDIPSFDSTPKYDPMDISGIGHGTHVSGMMAAASDNAIGIVGGMPFRGRIMGVKIFKDDGTGNLTTSSQYFYNGIQWAYSHGANVINLSVGSIQTGPNSDPLAEQGLTEAVQHGSVAIVVIGNADGGANGGLIDGTNLSSIPGQYATIDGVIGVGSFDVNTGDKSFFSHYSTTYAEIGAPGAEQGTTGLFSTLPVALSSYGRLAGTSQAAPMVSAAAGLTMGLIREAYGGIPAPKEVERLIETSAIKSSQLTPYFKDGNRLDFLTLVQYINQQYPRTNGGRPVNLCP